eukprot:COSAG03_NODE_26806_length_257_cov_0.506329_1_plen_35_part_10
MWNGVGTIGASHIDWSRHFAATCRDRLARAGKIGV